LPVQAFVEEIRLYARWVTAADLSNSTAVTDALRHLSSLYSAFWSIGGYVDGEANAPEAGISREVCMKQAFHAPPASNGRFSSSTGANTLSTR
jgi:hypothetical protein